MLLPLLLISISVISVSGTVEYSFYGGYSCNNSVIQTGNTSTGQCFTLIDNEVIISASIDCYNNLSSSPWISTVFYSQDCSGFSIFQLEGGGDCECDSSKFIDDVLSLSVNCDATDSTNCSATDEGNDDPEEDPYEEFPVYSAVYEATACNEEGYYGGGVVTNGICEEVIYEGLVISVHIICSESTTDGNWSVYVHGNGHCFGSALYTATGTSSTQCVTVDLHSSAALSMYVNCAGYAEEIYNYDSTNHRGSGSKKATLIGLVVGVIVGAFLIVGVGYYMCSVSSKVVSLPTSTEITSIGGYNRCESHSSNSDVGFTSPVPR